MIPVLTKFQGVYARVGEIHNSNGKVIGISHVGTSVHQCQAAGLGKLRIAPWPIPMPENICAYSTLLAAYAIFVAETEEAPPTTDSTAPSTPRLTRRMLESLESAT